MFYPLWESQKMTLDPRSAAIVLALLLAGTQIHAESLSERRAAKEKVESIEVACGKLDKENCAIVVPEINSKTVSQGVHLKPIESKGTVESLNGVRRRCCSGCRAG
jgi:hypothetical protein